MFFQGVAVREYRLGAIIAKCGVMFTAFEWASCNKALRQKYRFNPLPTYEKLSQQQGAIDPAENLAPTPETVDAAHHPLRTACYIVLSD